MFIYLIILKLIIEILLIIILPCSNDTQAEWDVIKEECVECKPYAVVTCFNWSMGGAGAVDLAEAVINACNSENNFRYIFIALYSCVVLNIHYIYLFYIRWYIYIYKVIIILLYLNECVYLFF